jgi:hypothetical protein
VYSTGEKGVFIAPSNVVQEIIHHNGDNGVMQAQWIFLDVVVNGEYRFDEIYDLLAVRIVFKPKAGLPEKTQCWNIYSLVTDVYSPKPERIRDWVSVPKANGYEALHLTVMGPSGQWFEVQIRS